VVFDEPGSTISKGKYVIGESLKLSGFVFDEGVIGLGDRCGL